MRPTRLVFALLILLAPMAVGAQYEGQSEDRAQNWLQNCKYRGNYDRAHFCELRNISSGGIEIRDGRETGAHSGWDG